MNANPQRRGIADTLCNRLSNDGDSAHSPVMGFNFIFPDGTVGQPYRIQVSPSLAEGSWVDWQILIYNGPVGVTDVSTTGVERRYYCAISP